MNKRPSFCIYSCMTYNIMTSLKMWIIFLVKKISIIQNEQIISQTLAYFRKQYKTIQEVNNT
jgi:hypothetical protein